MADFSGLRSCTWTELPAHLVHNSSAVSGDSAASSCDLTLLTCLLIASYRFCIIPLLAALHGKDKKLWRRKWNSEAIHVLKKKFIICKLILFLPFKNLRKVNKLHYLFVFVPLTVSAGAAHKQTPLKTVVPKARNVTAPSAHAGQRKVLSALVKTVGSDLKWDNCPSTNQKWCFPVCSSFHPDRQACCWCG